MAKIEKHAQFMDQLHSMITKQATAGTATGVPGKDTHYTSVSPEHDHVDKNKEGKPEHNPQEFKQEKATDKSDPTKAGHGEHKHAEDATKEAGAKVAPQATSTAAPALAKEEAHTSIKQEVHNKKAEEAPTNEKLAELGNQLLAAIEAMNKQATAGTATGVPGKDTHYTSVSSEHDHVNKNKEGKPEHNPQEFKQEKATDKSDPTKTHKHAQEAELDKEASFELGRQFARTFLASKTASDTTMYKEAGRRDFETLIATAAAELDAEGKAEHTPHMRKTKAPAFAPKQAEEAQLAKQAEEEAFQVKQAEEAGAQAFYTMLKQAQEEEKAAQTKYAFEQHINSIVAEKNAAEARANQLAAKLAEKEEFLHKQAEEAKLDAKFAQWGGRMVEEVISRLKNESSKQDSE